MTTRLIFLLWTLLASQANAAPVKNGFDLQGSLIPSDQIFHGGPEKDGIPSIDKPLFISSSAADFLKPSDRVLGVQIEGKAKAYPIKILNWHEIVNDSIAGQGIVVSYCPLCGTGIVFQAKTDDRFLHFGVSGLLYNSDVLLYDRETDSLWSQILGKSVNGEFAGKSLNSIPSSHTSWEAWKKKYPDTLVLSTDTGVTRDYTDSPYGSYDENGVIYFPLGSKSKRYHPKERVLGICDGSKCKAYPFQELSQSANSTISDTFAGKPIEIRFDVDNLDGEIIDSEGKPFPLINGFWFAWFAFHPETEVYEHGQ